jgi:alkylated DNA repair protein (DNA oxidative demethylase)
MDLCEGHTQTTALGRAVLMNGFARTSDLALLAAMADVLRTSPFRHITTPGGWRMSVVMSNCGDAGWVSDRTGYRYDPIDPETGQPWPPMPPVSGEISPRVQQKWPASPPLRPTHV